ncbi:MAG: L-carnitine dehydratase/bile acid-inducible protein [Acidimicrobiales bacterium]|jgi:crotonobetainyl-CoA:carnitine CoA-transferase CaiB-like acyl-CoA transferase|nr:L-carnitine dehydratase/bile acid-inducible protein [Acidimicrobiales bacterium]
MPDLGVLPDAAFHGLKVVEIAQLIAGPLSGSLLADLGADVVHVEDPGSGDPHRATGVDKDGVHLWWKVSGRNKRSVTLDLRSEEGQEIARRLVRWADVVITNFRPETLENWKMDWPSLHEVNPKLIMLQVTGFGANSSRRNSRGYGKVGEAMSGVVYLTGFPDGPPVHTGFSHADSTTGLFGAFAIAAALFRRSTDPDFQGEWIDMALFEALYRLCEWQVTMYDQLGVVPTRAGNQLANAPAAVVNTYLSVDDQWVTVTTGTAKAVLDVAKLLGEPVEDYDSTQKQNDRRDRLDELLRQFVAERTCDDALETMRKTGVVASRIYNVEDILADQTYAEREEIVVVDDSDLGPVRMPAALPKMANHGGQVWRSGPKLGEDNDLVYKSYLGLTDEEYEALQKDSVI